MGYVKHVFPCRFVYWRNLEYVSSATDVAAMFTAAASFSGYLSKWDVPSVRDMSRMFSSADSFNGDISEWDVSRGARIELHRYDSHVR